MNQDAIIRELTVERDTAHASAYEANLAENDALFAIHFAVSNAYEYALRLIREMDIPDCADCAKMDPEDAVEAAAEYREAERDSYD